MKLGGPTGGGSGNFIPPSEGWHQAAIAHFIPLGWHDKTFKDETKRQNLVAMVLELAEKDSEGLPFVVTEKFTNSMNEKANLRKVLENIRGKTIEDEGDYIPKANPFTEAEVAEFDTDRIIGVNCLVRIVHKERDGRVRYYANDIMALPKGFEKLELSGNLAPNWIKKVALEGGVSEDELPEFAPPRGGGGASPAASNDAPADEDDEPPF